MPNAVADTHLKIASGLSVKVLLLLLRHNGQLESAEMAQMLAQPAADIQDAVNYWVQCGVISSEDGTTAAQAEPAAAGPVPSEEAVSLTPTLQYQMVETPGAVPSAPATPPSAAPSDHPAEAEQTERKIATLTQKRRRFSTPEINEMAREDETIAYLLQEAQTVLGKPLTALSTDTVVALYSYYGMQPDLILMIIHYCVSIGKDSMNYIEKVAANWLENGIDTHEKAEAELLRQTRRNSTEGKIKKAFGIYDRNLVASERKYIAAWTEEYKQDMALITLAYERSVELKGKLSFPYINGILTNWHNQGVTTTVQAMKEIRENRPSRPEQDGRKDASYSMDELEKMITYGDI